jgi:transposase
MENILVTIDDLKQSSELTQREAVELKAEVAGLKAQVEELRALVKYYEELFRLQQHRKFGTSSEKTHPDQLSLFDEAENEADKREPEPAVEEIHYTRRRAGKNKIEDLSDLPVERVEHTLPEEERLCPECGGQMHVMGHDTRRELEIIPAQVKVVEHVSEVYACRNCEQNAESVPIVKAPQPEPVIKGSAASASSVAHIMTQKYVNAVPLYRQEQEFLMNGFLLSRQTMANWMIRASEDWLEPLYDLMKLHLLQEEVLHADETTLQVLKEPGKSSRSESYMWLYRTGGCASHPIVLYEYQPTRSSSHPKAFLEEFCGYLHTDGYAGYHALPPNVTIVGCWAHARRKFDETVKSAPPEAQGDTLARHGLNLCNELFRLEQEYKTLTPEERFQERQKRSKPISDALFSWAENLLALPKSLLGKAVHYLLGQKAYLENVFLDGRLELSNNRAERSIKPFVIGRKNWLFSATPKGAKASSVIYSLIETAKENGLKPFEYLKHIFETMPNVRIEAYESLLPWSETLPDNCKLTPSTTPTEAASE